MFGYGRMVIMRKLIENPVYMTYEEMEKEFAGKWILVANRVDTPTGLTAGGIPVAVADTIFEGQRDGFYEKFRAPEYAPRIDLDFNYDNLPGLMGFYEISEMDEEYDTTN